VREGRPGKVTRLATSRPLKLPDGLRPLNGETFLMAEGGGMVDRVSIDGDKVAVEEKWHGSPRGSFLIFSIRPLMVRRDCRSTLLEFRLDLEILCVASP
jgi:hypothetical protein